MDADVKRQIGQLDGMTVAELREKWREVYGEEAPNSHPRFLVKRPAWRIQANVEGDLSERARRRAMELANDADLRLKAPRERQPEAGGGTVPPRVPRSSRGVSSTMKKTTFGFCASAIGRLRSNWSKEWRGDSRLSAANQGGAGLTPPRFSGQMGA